MQLYISKCYFISHNCNFCSHNCNLISKYDFISPNCDVSFIIVTASLKMTISHHCNCFCYLRLISKCDCLSHLHFFFYNCNNTSKNVTIIATLSQNCNLFLAIWLHISKWDLISHYCDFISKLQFISPNCDLIFQNVTLSFTVVISKCEISHDRDFISYNCESVPQNVTLKCDFFPHDCKCIYHNVDSYLI